jgi:hypothetical protein
MWMVLKAQKNVVLAFFFFIYFNNAKMAVRERRLESDSNFSWANRAAALRVCRAEKNEIKHLIIANISYGLICERLLRIIG